MGFLRPDQCSVCGRNIAGMEDARKEGGRWFCSPSCLMQGSSGTWKHSKRSGPARIVRRVVLSILVVFVALAALGGVLAYTGSHHGKLSLGNHFLTPVSGSSGMVAFRHRAGAWDGWTVKVTAAKLHAFQLLGPSTKKTAAGGQDAMVSLSIGYSGGGYGHFRDLLTRLYVQGSGSSIYYEADSGDLNCTATRGTPSQAPLNERSTLVFPGHKRSGHLCFLIAHRDAKTLALYLDKPGCNTAGPKSDNCQDRRRFSLR